jgi:hypothetical protein
MTDNTGRRGRARNTGGPTNHGNAVTHIGQALAIIEEEKRQGRLTSRDEALLLLSLAQAEASLAVADRLAAGIPLAQQSASVLDNLATVLARANLGR